MPKPKPYLLNGDPVTSEELIEEAKRLDTEFKNDTVYFTCDAASVIRLYGGTVEINFIENGIGAEQLN